MSTWLPITESELWDVINRDCEGMTIQQNRLWEKIQISPEKWQLSPWGDLGGGFWVVALLGQTAVWFNDIEEGFNRSSYSKHGVLDGYWCNQDELGWTVQHLLDEVAGTPAGVLVLLVGSRWWRWRFPPANGWPPSGMG